MSMLSIIHLVVFLLWLPVALVASLFFFWRILMHEHIDNLDGVIDRAVIALLGALVVARLGYCMVHFSSFGFILSKWVDVIHNPGLLASMGVGGWLVLFARLTSSKWKDVYGLLDFAVAPIAFFFFCFAFLDLLMQIMGIVVTLVAKTDAVVPVLSIRGMLFPFFSMAVDLFLVVLLQRLEQVYRTFLWYRAKRRSAETGFVVAVFLLIYGFSGFVLGALNPGVDAALKLLVMVTGFVVLYVRSGRGIPFRS